jgi:hypothetical protein
MTQLQKWFPDALWHGKPFLVVGGGSSIDGLAATLTKVLAGQANLPSPPSLTAGPEKAQG